MGTAHHFAAAWSCVLVCKVNSTGTEVSAPPPEKVMFPLILARFRRLDEAAGLAVEEDRPLGGLDLQVALGRLEGRSCLGVLAGI